MPSVGADVRSVAMRISASTLPERHMVVLLISVSLFAIVRKC